MSGAPGAWKYYVTGVTTAWMQEVGQRMEQLPSKYPKGYKCSQQSSNLKGDGYITSRPDLLSLFDQINTDNCRIKR